MPFSYNIKVNPSHVITVTVILTLLLFIPQIWLNCEEYDKFNSITENKFLLQKLSDEIIYFDEVLTMSARMNAATGDTNWEKRYRQFEPQLDTAIKQSINIEPEAYKNEDAKQIDAANQRLIAMEYQSFDLVKKNQKEAALQILASRDYEIQKQIYADGITKRRHDISLQLQQKIAEYRQKMFWATSCSVISLILLIPAWLLVLQLLQKYLKAKKIAQAALKETNSMLEMQVANRTEILNQKNIQLEQTLQELQQTQLQLIQTEKMSSLGQLVAGVAHEINNPVNFIYGNLIHVKEYTQQLLSVINLYQQKYCNYNAEIAEMMDTIDFEFILDDLPKSLSSMTSGADRIREIVLSLRNFSRLDEADMKPVDIHEGIENTLLILQYRLNSNHKHQEITIIKDYGDLPLVECYAGGMNQAFMNILANAIDALHEQEIHYLEAGNKEYSHYIIINTQVKNEESIVISIKDNGPGMTEEVRNRLFDPFFTTKPVGKGTGLGLSITYQIIVDKHKGKIDCVSTHNQGTEFVIEIPIQQIISCPVKDLS